jgi:sugar phosphate isomerase/epimerase
MDVTESRLSRRGFLGAAAGAAAVAALGSRVPTAASAGGQGERLIPPGKFAIQLFTVRDAVSRLDNSVIDPLTGQPLRGGFRGVFEELASYGYTGIEFAGYTQGANGAITIEQIRALLDEYGLKAVGAHVGLGNWTNPAQRPIEIERGQILGMEYIGTASAPTGSGTAAAWQAAAETFNTIGEAVAAGGLKFYQHTHQNEYNFFTDGSFPGIRRYDKFLEWTNPAWVYSQLDIYWAHVARVQFPNPVDGSRFDVLGQIQAYPNRYPSYHVKDGVLTSGGTNLTFVDVGDGIIASGGGTIGTTGDIAVPANFRTIFDEAGRKGWRLYIQERDNAPGGSSDPGRSFRSAKRSAEYMLGLRAGPDGNAWTDEAEVLETSNAG